MIAHSLNLDDSTSCSQEEFPKYCHYNKFLLVEEIALEDYTSLHYGKCCVIGKLHCFNSDQFGITNIKLPNLAGEYSLREGTLSIKLLTTHFSGTLPISGRTCEIIGEVVLYNKKNTGHTISSRGIHEQTRLLKSEKEKREYIEKLTNDYEPAIHLWRIKEIDRAGELAELNLQVRMLKNQSQNSIM